MKVSPTKQPNKLPFFSKLILCQIQYKSMNLGLWNVFNRSFFTLFGRLAEFAEKGFQAPGVRGFLVVASVCARISAIK